MPNYCANLISVPYSIPSLSIIDKHQGTCNAQQSCTKHGNSPSNHKRAANKDIKETSLEENTLWNYSWDMIWSQTSFTHCVEVGAALGGKPATPMLQGGNPRYDLSRGPGAARKFPSPRSFITWFMGSAGVLGSVTVTEQEMMDGGIVCYGGLAGEAGASWWTSISLEMLDGT